MAQGSFAGRETADPPECKEKLFVFEIGDDLAAITRLRNKGF